MQWSWCDDLAQTIPSTSDIEVDSEIYRADDLSQTIPSTSDIEVDSEIYRADDLAQTVPSVSDLEVDSEVYRADDLAQTIPSVSDLEVDSEIYRADDLAQTVPSVSDLEVDSEIYRADDLSQTVPSVSDLEVDSEIYREDDLAQTVPSNSDIETDSVPYRTDDLTNNVPSTSDIETDSVPFRTDDLTNNVPSTSDIETDSVPFRTDDLTNNVPSTSDIETDSVPYRTDDLTNNVPSTSDIEADSIPFRTDDLAKRTKTLDSDIATDSVDYRQGMLNKNRGLGLLGVNFQGFGTSAFVGISRNYALGLIAREALMVRNEYTPRNPYPIDGSDRRLEQGNYTGYFGRPVKDEIDTQLWRGESSVRRTPTKTYPVYDEIKERRFPTTTPFEVDFLGQMNKVTVGNELEKVFQDKPTSIRNLMDSIGQRDNDSTPLARNFRPNSQEFLVGTNSITNDTIISRKRYTVDNPYFSGNGVKKAGKLLFAITNYAIPEEADFRTMYFPPYIQSFQENENANWTTHEFLGRPEPVYTYNNATRGGSITFFVLTDYAQDVEIGTDWTDENLQRILFNADPVTIGRDDTVSDKSIETSRSFTESYRKKIEEASVIASQEAKIKLIDEQISALSSELSSMRDQFDQDVHSGNTAYYNGKVAATASFIDHEPSSLAIFKEIEDLQQEKLSIADSLKQADPDFVTLSEREFTYSETSSHVDNSTSLFLGAGNASDFAILERLNTMKESLMFQPAFFSGDKLDFIRKMSFLSRVTRPRSIGTGVEQGYSFTKAPVCHIRLGDYLNHDCIITDVSKDYTDANWALEEGAVQPMWATVTINFQIVGQYGNSGKGTPLLADDSSGYYNNRVNPTGNE